MSKSKKLEDFLPQKDIKKKAKPIYTMVRFDQRPELMEFVEKRVKKLSTSKNAYMLALIEKDKAENGQD